MRKLALSCFSLLAATGLAYAGTPCNGFEIKIKNNTADDLLVTKMQMVGGEFQPSGFEIISARTEQVYTVNNTVNDGRMQSVMEFNSLSFPSKKAYIRMDLRNGHMICHHDLRVATGDYPISHYRSLNKVKFTVG